MLIIVIIYLLVQLLKIIAIQNIQNIHYIIDLIAQRVFPRDDKTFNNIVFGLSREDRTDVYSVDETKLMGYNSQMIMRNMNFQVIIM